MKLVVIDVSELQNLIHDAVVAAHSGSRATDEWVDARSSPLGRNAFLKLAREGAFPIVKLGNKYVARRGDIDAYLDRQRVERRPPQPSVGGSHRNPDAAPVAVEADDDPIERALAAGRLRIVKSSER